MQDKDSDVLHKQRKRRKRIGRIKSAVAVIVTGWILLSMILIVMMFARILSLERKMDSWIQESLLLQMGGFSPDDDADTSEEVSVESLQTDYTRSSATGEEDVDNQAQVGDIHKVYLTFDEGPSENTQEILDILAFYDVKAAFFVVGREDEESQELYRRIVEEGHTLGMRSYANKYSVIYQSKEAFEADYQKLRDYLYEVTGTESIYYRFPGGSSNTISNVPMDELISFLNDEGIIYYDWNVSAADAASVSFTADEIVENVVSDVVKYKTSVVLFHDSDSASVTVEALEPLIESLQEMDAEILPIDEDTKVIQSVKAESMN